MGHQSVRSEVANLANVALKTLDVKLVRANTKYWDHYFARWIAEAKQKGIDPE